MKMKEIPENDRPYERCMKEGPGQLTDAELLSVILRTGSRELNSMELANRILDLNYPNDGILGLLRFSLEEFMQVNGVGKVKGVQLLCIGELSRRIWKRRLMEQVHTFTSPKAIADYYQETMRHLGQEHLYLMMFDTKQHLIRDILLSKGTVNSSLIGTREVFVEALKAQAVSVILVHNHPSGDPTPSEADRYFTRKVAAGGELVGIVLLDHIVIGDGCFFSMKDRGYF